MTSKNLETYGPVDPPGEERIVGMHVTLEPITDERRFAELFEAFASDETGETFRYLGYGPFDDREDFDTFARATYLADDLHFYALIPSSSGHATGDNSATNRACGVMALMRADTRNGVIEIGHICLAPRLQRTVASSEAVFQLLQLVFETLGYRRFEWKCDSGNERSRRAAERFGFTFEGVFRQHMVVKGKNRDTAWFSIVDGEWPAMQAGFEAWLDQDNFDADGKQKKGLAELRDEIARS